MAIEKKTVEIGNLPLTENGSIRVELIPMPDGDNPWRTRAEYKAEKRRDTFRFWFTIASLVISVFSVVITAFVAVSKIQGAC